MDVKYQQQIAEYVSDFHLPRYREIPDFGLRLEQITRYLEKYVPASLTGSMVSNYVKQKLVPAPIKKSYPRESIAYLLFISYIKTVMTLDDIRLMIDVQKNSYTIEVAYNYFCDEFENLLRYACGITDAPAHIGRSHSPEKELLRTALLSITYKMHLDLHLRLIREGRNAEPLLLNGK